MNEKKVLISLVSKQSDGDGSPETLEIATEGTFKQTPEGTYIEYDEPDEGMGKSKSGILINTPEHITMTRSGDYNAQLVIEKGVRHNCLYETPYGSLIMGVFAREAEAVFTADGGKIKLSYTVDINSEFLSENDVNISIKILE